MTSPLGRRIEPAVSTIGRLKRRPDFLAAAGGRRFHTEHMSAQGRLRDAAGTAMSGDEAAVEGLRVGFTITKQVGHATERNRIRRRLRDAVLRASADLPQAAADIVLVARRPALHAPFETLVADLRRSVGAVIKPGGGKRPDSGQAPRGGGRSGKGSGKVSGANKAPAAKAGPAPATLDAASPAAGSPAGRAASPSSHHPAAAAAQGEASLPHRASGDGRGPFPPSNTRDGSLDG